MPPLLEHYPLLAHNTFGFAVRARYAARITSEAELLQTLDDPRIQGLPQTILGGGSNVVLTRDLDGLTILMQLHGKHLVGETPTHWLVEACAGEPWHNFVAWTLAQGWPGLENLALIPGTVGAAPIQNIGAYGLELAERFSHLRAWDQQQQCFVLLDATACQFSYRDSLFKQAGQGRYLITAVTFSLPKQWHANTRYGELAQILADQKIVSPNPQQIFDAVVAIRRKKLPDPSILGNAGSFFKNPIVCTEQHAALQAQYPTLVSHRQADGRYKLAAGWLIDQCGWKGKRCGHVGVYEKQALILVHDGQGTGSDLLALAQAITHDVKTRFDVDLEAEPVVIPAQSADS